MDNGIPCSHSELKHIFSVLIPFVYLVVPVVGRRAARRTAPHTDIRCGCPVDFVPEFIQRQPVKEIRYIRTSCVCVPVKVRGDVRRAHGIRHCDSELE